MRLNDLGGTLSWRDLAAFVQHSPRDSAIGRAVNPDWWVTPELIFLRDIAYSLSWLVWAKSTDAKHNRNRPKPVPLTEAEQRMANPHREQYEARPIEETMRFLGWDDVKA